MKKYIIFVMLLFISVLIINIFAINNLYLNDKHKTVDYVKGKTIINITPYYDFQKIVDYEGSKNIDYKINKKTALEIGKSIIISTIKKEVKMRGEYMTNEDIFDNLTFYVNNEELDGKKVYKINAKSKSKFFSFGLSKVLNYNLNNLLREEGLSIFIDNDNGKIYKCILNKKEVSPYVDENCASKIALSIFINCYIERSNKNNIMEYWHKNDYENGTYTYISDAKGVAIEGENEDEFFQIRQCSKINID